MSSEGERESGVGACRRWLQGIWLLALACNAGCYRHDDPADQHSALVGRYEPSSLPDGGANYATQPCMRAEIADAGSAQPAGHLDIAFTPAVAPGVQGEYDTEVTGHLSAAAIWIEDEHGALVKTLDLWCYSPFCLRCLPAYYGQFGGGCVIDVTTRATLHAYEPWMKTWDGTSLHGSVVPDGNYTFNIDLQIDEQHPMDVVKIPFTKGRTAWTITPPPMPPQTGLTLTYTPQ
jgi:hypothetical protein